MVFVLCIKETDLPRDLILAQQVNREKSVIEKVMQKALVSKRVFRQSSEALKYKFNRLKKKYPRAGPWNTDEPEPPPTQWQK